MGGFEEWTSTVGGILWHAGYRAWMGNYRDWIRSSDQFAADAESLLRLWQSRYPDGRTISARDVLALAEEAGVFPAIFARSSQQSQLVSLARSVLTPLCNRPVAGLMVARKGYGSSSLYSIASA